MGRCFSKWRNYFFTCKKIAFLLSTEGDWWRLLLHIYLLLEVGTLWETAASHAFAFGSGDTISSVWEMNLKLELLTTFEKKR